MDFPHCEALACLCLMARHEADRNQEQVIFLLRNKIRDFYLEYGERDIFSEVSTSTTDFDRINFGNSSPFPLPHLWQKTNRLPNKQQQHCCWKFPSKRKTFQWSVSHFKQMKNYCIVMEFFSMGVLIEALVMFQHCWFSKIFSFPVPKFFFSSFVKNWKHIHIVRMVDCFPVKVPKQESEKREERFDPQTWGLLSMFTYLLTERCIA